MQDKTAEYRAQIVPLIEQIDKLAQEHGIPFVMVFQTSDGGHERSAYIPPRSHKEMRQLWEWLSSEAGHE